MMRWAQSPFLDDFSTPPFFSGSYEQETVIAASPITEVTRYIFDQDMTQPIVIDESFIDRTVFCLVVNRIGKEGLDYLRPYVLNAADMAEDAQVDAVIDSYLRLPSTREVVEAAWEVEPRAPDLGLVDYLTSLGIANPSASALGEAMTMMDRAFEARDFVRIDENLRAADASRLAPASMLALLRSSYAFRNHLPGWIGFKDRVRDELLRRGRDAEHLLRGL